MKQFDPHVLFERALREKGVSATVNSLLRLLNESDDDLVLTIIANAGVHEIPESYLRGDIFEASRGNWDVSSQPALEEELSRILVRLAKKLRSASWKKVYLVPTGHPILSIQIKTMVYRVLRLNTIDLYYKSGIYFEVDIDQRAIAIESGAQ